MKPTFRKIYSEHNFVSNNKLTIKRRPKLNAKALSPEEMLSPEALRKLHNDIHFTKQLKAVEMLERTFSGLPE